jgi:hypothetical protein
MKITRHFFVFVFSNVLFIACLFAQNTIENTLLQDTIFRKGSPLFKEVIDKARSYKLQIIYTQIERGSYQNQSFHTYSFHSDSSNYFYPASLVKLPLSALALEKISSLKSKGIQKFTKIEYDSAYSCQTSLKKYKNPPEGHLSIGDFIRRMMLVSDNESYSRTYEFCGPGYLHKRLSEMGYESVRITHRFNPACDSLENRHTNPVRFYNHNGALLFEQPAEYASERLVNPLGKVRVGKANIINEKPVKTGRDFTHSNYLPLADVHRMMQSIMFPLSLDEKYRFRLSEEDLAFLRKYLRTYPRSSKYLFYGRDPKVKAHNTLRIYNVVGMSYGFLADCAYFADPENNIDFFLSAVIYTNKSDIINSGNYEYKTIGLPFLKELGQLVYDYEIRRKKNQQPELIRLLKDSY